MFDKVSRLAYLHPHLHGGPNPSKGGLGVFAHRPVRAGELLMVWGGFIASRQQLEALPDWMRHRSVQVDDDHYLISPVEDEPADYINHSCDPNGGLSGQISVVAMRDIEPGEEVCFDYAMSDSTSYDEFECQCGSKLCRGKITGNDWMLPELQVRYAGYFSPYLQRRIRRLTLPVAEFAPAPSVAAARSMVAR